MVAQGHGNHIKQRLGSWDRSSKQGFTMERDGRITLRDSKDREIGDFAKLFGKKFRSRHSTIVFQGCQTGDEEKNLARATSEALPGVKVIGNLECGWGFAHVLRTDYRATVPPLSAGGFSTFAATYYKDPQNPDACSHQVGTVVNQVIR